MINIEISKIRVLVKGFEGEEVAEEDERDKEKELKKLKLKLLKIRKGYYRLLTYACLDGILLLKYHNTPLSYFQHNFNLILFFIFLHLLHPPSPSSFMLSTTSSPSLFFLLFFSSSSFNSGSGFVNPDLDSGLEPRTRSGFYEPGPGSGLQTRKTSSSSPFSLIPLSPLPPSSSSSVLTISPSSLFSLSPSSSPATPLFFISPLSVIWVFFPLSENHQNSKPS